MIALIALSSLATAQDLNVNGVVEAQDFIYSSTRERTIGISPHAFVWDDPSSGVKEGNGFWVNVTEGSLRAGVILPPGVQIETYTCFIRDDSTSHAVKTYLRRTPLPISGITSQNLGFGVSESVGSTTTGAFATTLGDTEQTDFSLINDDTSVGQQAYHIQYNPTDGCSGGLCRLYGCLVTYSVDAVD